MNNTNDTGPAALKSSMTAASSTNAFAVAYLQLCEVSYLLPTSSIASAVAKVPPLNPGGRFTCAWGPAQTSDEANLVFVAVYDYGPGQPVFAAVVIRGTDVDVSDPIGILQQIWEDADVLSWGPMPWCPTSPARVANGSLDSLRAIQGLSSGGQTLQQFLESFLSDPANDNPVVVVTGHSLGGGLVTVVAPWLKSALGDSGVHSPIVPTSFAAPTAGNAAFAAYFAAKFAYAPRYNNSLDVVPLGWWNLSGVETIYHACGLEIPDLMYGLIFGWESLMSIAAVSYVQPRSSDAPLTGRCLATDDWYAELGYQHHTTTYMTLMGGKSVVPSPASFAPARHRSPRSTLYARFGSIAALVHRR